MGEGHPIAAAVGERLRERGESLAVAESLTGGLIGARITAVPGASDYFDRGIATYADDAKRAELAVPRETLDEHGAVSAEVAAAMARGVRDVADATWGLSATGIAGPTGGTDGKPVGLTYVGIAYAAPWGTGDSYARTVRFVADGDRQAVRSSVVERALRELRADLEGTRNGSDGADAGE